MYVDNSYTWLTHKTHSHTKVTLNIFGINKLPQNLYAKQFYFSAISWGKGQRISSQGQRMGFTPFFEGIRIESIPCEELA